ncbi:MAG: AAA family ATPase [Thermoplasmata archaeon]
MVFFVVIRGPLGVGKSSVAERLAKEINGAPISIDQILEDHNLWEAGHLSEFLKANEFAIGLARGPLSRGTPVIFDGNFYWKTQLNDLIGGLLPYRAHVFTLIAPLSVCVERDSQRARPYGPEAARQVYSKSTRFEWGVRIDADRPIGNVVSEIALRLG